MVKELFEIYKRQWNTTLEIWKDKEARGMLFIISSLIIFIGISIISNFVPSFIVSLFLIYGIYTFIKNRRKE